MAEGAGFEPERKRPSPIHQNDDLHCDHSVFVPSQNLLHARGNAISSAVRVMMVDRAVRRVADETALPVVMARRREPQESPAQNMNGPTKAANGYHESWIFT